MSVDPTKDALREAVERLTVQMENPHWHIASSSEPNYYQARVRTEDLRTVLSAMGEVEAVLRPFSEIEIKANCLDSQPVLEFMGDTRFAPVHTWTCGHFRAAHALLAKLQRARGDRG